MMPHVRCLHGATGMIAVRNVVSASKVAGEKSSQPQLATGLHVHHLTRFSPATTSAIRPVKCPNGVLGRLVVFPVAAAFSLDGEKLSHSPLEVVNAQPLIRLVLVTLKSAMSAAKFRNGRNGHLVVFLVEVEASLVGERSFSNQLAVVPLVQYWMIPVVATLKLVMSLVKCPIGRIGLAAALPVAEAPKVDTVKSLNSQLEIV